MFQCHQNLITSGIHKVIILTKLQQFLISSLVVFQSLRRYTYRQTWWRQYSASPLNIHALRQPITLHHLHMPIDRFRYRNFHHHASLLHIFTSG